MGEEVVASHLRSLLGKRNWMAGGSQAARTLLQMMWDVALGRVKLTDRFVAEQLGADEKWWLRRLELWSKGGASAEWDASLLQKEALVSDTVFVASDTGDTGAGVMYVAPGEARAPRFWSVAWPNVKPRSSLEMEMMSVLLFVRAHPELVAGRVLTVVGDSKGMVCNLLTGKSKASPGLLAALCDELEGLRARVFATWVPREMNHMCDLTAELAHNHHTPLLTGRLEEIEVVYRQHLEFLEATGKLERRTRSRRSRKAGSSGVRDALERWWGGRWDSAGAPAVGSAEPRTFPGSA